MAKLTTFFRRIFTSFTLDEDSPASSDSRKSVLIIPPLSPSQTKIYSPQKTSYSCSPSPRLTTRFMIKQTTIQIDHIHDNNSSTDSKSSPPSIPKINNRRLSAPMIIHASTIHPFRQQRSPVVSESAEEDLISPLQRLSSSSINHNNSVHSLGPSVSCSASTSPRHDRHLSPSNSMNTPNFSPTTGTPPSLQIAPGGQSSSSPRASIPSNNSTSPVADRRMSLQTRGRRPSMFDPIDPNELQQALYASAAAKARLPSNTNNDEDNNRAISRLSISYDRDSEHVFLDTLSFENLQALDGYMNNNNGDWISFYCRFRLLPEKRSLFQTKPIRINRCQASYLFDSKVLSDFQLSYDQLNNHAIEILLYKISTTKPLFKDIRIATVKYDLNSLSKADQSRMKKSLEEPDPSTINQDPDLGELLVSLSYLQSAAKLSVVILEAKSLRPLTNETKTYPDVCVKVTLYDRNGKRLKRKKTSVQRTSDCPIFNEELVFELRRDIASEVTIEIRLVHESLSYKEQLGSIIFGPVISNLIKGPISPENVYWSTILSGESLNAQWQILKSSIKIEEIN